MRIKACSIAAVVLLLNAPPALAQVQCDISQLDQRADPESNRILLRLTIAPTCAVAGPPLRKQP